MNLYNYVNNDPVNGTDSSGLCSTISDAAVQADCINAWSIAKIAARQYISKSDTNPGALENAYISTFNEKTSEITTRTGDAAGERTNGGVVCLTSTLMRQI